MEPNKTALRTSLLHPVPLGVVTGAVLLRPPPDADHVIAGHSHHVLVVVTAGHLGTSQLSIRGVLSLSMTYLVYDNVVPVQRNLPADL